MLFVKNKNVSGGGRYTLHDLFDREYENILMMFIFSRAPYYLFVVPAIKNTSWLIFLDNIASIKKNIICSIKTYFRYNYLFF